MARRLKASFVTADGAGPMPSRAEEPGTAPSISTVLTTIARIINAHFMMVSFSCVAFR
ncbi:MAG: hypothetical protein BWY09_01159 [Candidatus Hydrogenedentes bacterium ADurb.Bin179]|nr:MAG: hypothetical protein BWY09_01159 [Candidatus Hydrogenedentes bacterium ADurb.Bin179]